MAFTTTYNIQVNGSGTVTKKDMPLPSGRYVYYRAVYYKPNNGTFIDYIQINTKNSSDRADFNYSETTTFSNFSPIENTNDEHLGCHLVGYEYKTIHENSTFFNGTYQTTNQTANIYETQQDFTLEVKGNKSIQNLVQYCRYNYRIFMDNKELPSYITATYTKFFIKSDEQHTYTNLVGFLDSSYSGGNPGSFALYSIGKESSYGSFKTEYKDIVIKSSLEKNVVFKLTTEESSQIKRFILYVDCRVCIFRAAHGFNHLDQADTGSKYSFTVYSTMPSYANQIKDDGSYDENDVKNLLYPYLNVPLLALKMVGNGKYVYPAEEMYHEIMESGQDTPTMTDGTDTIPYEHKWIGFCNGTSPFTTVARIVSNGENMIIGNVVDAESKFSRFTGYWLAYYYKDGKRRSKILSSNDKIPSEETIGNIEIHPILKPYAECDILVFDTEPNKVNKAFSMTTPNVLKRRLNKRYSKYRKHWYLDASDDLAKNRRILLDWAKTVSPFKFEMFCCHGGRYEYLPNEDTDYDSYISISGKNYARNWLPLHEKSKYWWNGSGFFSNNQCVCIYLESCFGGGMQCGIQRAILENCSATDDNTILPILDDVFYINEATATNCGTGNQYCSLSYPLIYRLAKERSSYSEFAAKYNSQVQNFTEKTFTLIKKFYVENYETMLSIVKKNEREMWENTYEMIIDDLNNCGSRYFRYHRFADGSDNNLSPDMYFHCQAELGDEDIEYKDYKIHDGFVGLIRKYVFKEDEDNTHKFFGVDDEDNTLQALHYDLQLKKICRGLKQLTENINTLVQSAFLGYPNWFKIFAIQYPSARCYGKFKDANVKMFHNPNSDYDKWLIDDDELICGSAFEITWA